MLTLSPDASRRRLVLDTNILLLLIVASVDDRKVGMDRLAGFTREDVGRIRHIASQFTRWATTPHILTEVANLIGQMFQGELRHRARRALHSAYVELEQLTESQESAGRLMSALEYPLFGLTDAGIARLAKRGDVVLTIDAPLAAHLETQGLVNVVNYNHWRQSTLLEPSE